MKTITIDNNGVVKVAGDLTDDEKLLVADVLFSQQETDNEGQVVIYTGIYEEDAEPAEDDESSSD